jgi:hypothetical protein
VGVGTGGSALGQRQLAAGGVVVEQFGVTAPLDGGFQLAARLVLAEMFIEQILKEFGGKSAVIFGFESLLHLTKKRDVGKSRFAKDGFAFLNIAFGKGQTFGSDDGVAFFDFEQAEKCCGVDSGKKGVDFEAEFVGEHVQIGAVTLINENFEQTSHAARTSVRKHEVTLLRGQLVIRNLFGSEFGMILASEGAIDKVDEFGEARRFPVARIRQLDGELRVDVGGIAAQDNDAIGEKYGFLDVVSNDKNGARGNLLAEPQFQQFAAQRFGGQDIQRREGLVHEKHFGFNDEGASHANALLHAAGELFGIGGFEAVETNRINDAQGTLVALDFGNAAGFERRFDIFDDGEPREKSEALKNDGNVGGFARDGLTMPIDSAPGSGREAGEHAKHGRFAAAGRAEQANNLARVNGDVRRSDDLYAAAIGLGVELFESPRFDDGLGCCGDGAHGRVYYRSSQWRSPMSKRA